MVNCAVCNRIFGKLIGGVCEDCEPTCVHCRTRHRPQPSGLISITADRLLQVSVVDGGMQTAPEKLIFCNVNCLNDWIDELLPTALRCEWCDSNESEEWVVLKLVDGKLFVGNALDARASYHLTLCSSRCFFAMMEGRYDDGVGD